MNEVGTDTSVRLTVPASPDYLRLARLASADAGSRAGLDVDEIDDLRIAVSELCHLLVGAGSSGDLTLEFKLVDGGVVVDGHASEPGVVDTNEISERILSTVADEHQVTDEGDGRHFHLLKHHRP